MDTTIAVKSEINMGEWTAMKEQAGILVKSGFCPPALNTAEKVIAVMLTARELRIGSMEAIRSINIIQGKPAMSAQLMLALCQRTKEVESFAIKEGADGATVTIKRKGQEPYTAHFGPIQAQALGLIGKDNYKKQAATMYKWRAIAEATRFVFPDAVCGLYTPEELGADVMVTTDGDMIVKQPEPITEPQRLSAAQDADAERASFEETTNNGAVVGQDWKRMKARREGRCDMCADEIMVGDDIFYKPATKTGAHATHYK